MPIFWFGKIVVLYFIFFLGPTPDVAEAAGSDDDFSIMLTRFLSLAGHVALRHLVHLDVAVFGELRRRQRVQEQDTEMESNKTVSASAVKKAKQVSAGAVCVLLPIILARVQKPPVDFKRVI